MTYSIADLIKALNNREATVIAPLGIGEIRRLETALSRRLDSNFSEFYSYCDGFIDGNSYISIWTIEHVISNKNSDKLDENFIIIGDILMESDYIIANISDNEASIKLLYENRILSRNIKGFVEDLNSGKLDMFK